MLSIHRDLQKQWDQWLIPQDQQKLFPHITIQNKVDAILQAIYSRNCKKGFTPMEFYGLGLSLWEYLGGPWRFINTYEFKS